MLTGPMTNRRSNAKNAYDLLSDVKDYILEEPKRIWMRDWVISDVDDIKEALGTKGPACGTVGCIAGNVRVLTGNLNWKGSTSTLATGILSGDSRTLIDGLFNLFHDTEVDAEYGTKKYARIVAKRVEQFQNDYETDLRAVAVRPTSKGRSK